MRVSHTGLAAISRSTSVSWPLGQPDDHLFLRGVWLDAHPTTTKWRHHFHLIHQLLRHPLQWHYPIHAGRLYVLQLCITVTTWMDYGVANWRPLRINDPQQNKWHVRSSCLNYAVWAILLSTQYLQGCFIIARSYDSIWNLHTPGTY